MMKIYTFTFLFFLFSNLQGYCKPDINLGFFLKLTSPMEYTPGFIGKAYIMETESTKEPNFKAALTMEATGKGQYSCSLEVFLGDVKVWSSGHYTKMYVSDKCIIEFTQDGDLRLKSSHKHIGWRTGTAGQGAERLRIQSTGNLVLLDAMNLVKWQSFNFPTDVMLLGQRLDLAKQLISFPTDTTLFYSFEVLRDKISLFLNLNNLKYSYWEYKAVENKRLKFVKLAIHGLELFDDNSHKIGFLGSDDKIQPLRFLALTNKTGNLGLYSYKPEKGKFEAMFQALNNTCDLPVACKPYGICTLSKTCECMKIVSNEDCSYGVSILGDKKRFCDQEMVKVEGVTTVLRNGIQVRNVSKEGCEELCKKDCDCGAAKYSSAEGCFIYGIVMGIKEINRVGVGGWSYMVKIPKGERLRNKKSNLRKWVVGLVGGVDAFVILILLSGIGVYLVWKRRKNSLPPANRESR